MNEKLNNHQNIINPLPFLLLTILTLTASFHFLLINSDSIFIALVLLAIFFSLIPNYINLKRVKSKENFTSNLMKKLNGQTSSY